MPHSYNALFFVTIAAVLSPWLSAKLSRGFIPAVILEIVLGYVIGPHVLGLSQEDATIQFLADFGLAYLMFLSGIELDFDLIFEKSEPGERPRWLRGGMFFCSTLVISAIAAYLLLALGTVHNLVIVTLLLSATSLGIVMPTLKESGWISTRFGQEVLLYALISDVMTLILFTAYVTFHTTGNAYSVLLVMVLLLVFVVVYRLLHVARRFRVFRLVENATSEIGLRGSFALILAFLALSETLGTEVMIGAFLAGAIVSLLSEKHSLLTRKLNSIGYGFLIPIFFVHVGMKFDVHSLVATPGFVLAMLMALLAMFANRILPTLWFLRGVALRQRTAGGVLLAATLSLTIAASQIGAQLGILSVTMSNGFILLSILTCLVSTGIFARQMRSIPLPEGTGEVPKPETLTLDASTLPEGFIVEQIEVKSHRFHEMPLRVLGLPADLLVISIVRGDEVIIPRGHTVIEQFDTVHVMGEESVIEAVRRRFEGRRP